MKDDSVIDAQKSTNCTDYKSKINKCPSRADTTGLREVMVRTAITLKFTRDSE